MTVCFISPTIVGKQSKRSVKLLSSASPCIVSLSPNIASSIGHVPKVSRRNAVKGAAAVALSLLVPKIGGSVASSEAAEIDYLFDTQSGSFVPPSRLDGLFHRDAGSLFDRCIVAGEIHDNKRTHDAQLAVIDSARRIDDGRQLIVGFEQFYPSHNKHLDAYVQRDISLEAMLQLTDWEHTWGFDFGLYEPIFEYCRKHGILMRGLNLPFGIASIVGRLGLDGLPTPLKEVLPDMDFTNVEHYNHFVNLVQGSHSLGKGERADKLLRQYYQVQVLWEEWMSKSAAVSLEKHPDARFVFAIGSGHVEGRYGFPDRLQKRVNERPYTIVPKPVSWTNEDGYITPNISKPDTGVADLVWYTRIA